MAKLLLSEISLESFRNHENQTFLLGDITVILGNNGSGKTAVLEAISLLSVADSWKTDRDVEVVQWAKPFCRVVGGFNEVVIQASPSLKRYRIDGVSKRLGDVLGRMPTVLFQPDDSMVIHGSPAGRRALIDRLLSQVVPGYAKNLQLLQKVLKQRNKLLRQVQEGAASMEELPYWDQELISLIQQIQPAREKVLTEITPIITTFFHELIPEIGQLVVHYQKSPNLSGDVPPDFFEHQRHKEVAAGITLYGPHREDMTFTIDGHPADATLSRGQTRALVLAIKLAELTYIEKVSEVKPILLLDDIFAEFDQERRAKIFSLITKYQTVMTVTDLAGVEDNLPEGVTIIQLTAQKNTP
ncbi:DNA replication/repair protein RecF [soil metagenome]